MGRSRGRKFPLPPPKLRKPDFGMYRSQFYYNIIHNIIIMLRFRACTNASAGAY